MRKNQRGFSLIETIIVIAMIAVLAGSSIAMVGHIRYANTKKVAEEVDNALSRLRLDTISLDDPQYLYIYQIKNDGYYMVQKNEYIATPNVGPAGNLDGNAMRLCGNNVKFYKVKDNTSDLIEENEVICITYKKNGVFRVEDESLNIHGTNADHITIDGTGTYTICLDYETGKHYFE